MTIFTLFEEDFETVGNGSRYTTSTAEFSDGSGDFFTRTDGSNIGGYYSVSGFGGSYYFAAMDLDGEGASLPVTMSITGIDITDYTDLTFSVDLAEDDDGTNEDYDLSDYVTFQFSIDGGDYQNLLSIQSIPDGDAFNAVPALDTDFDGDGDGTTLSATFATFMAGIAETGSTLDLLITFNLNSGDEDIAIDNLVLTGSKSAALVISGVIDGPLSGGVPKAIELTVLEDIADLSLYGLGSANNGGGSDGQEITLSGSANAGDRIYIASESTGFTSFFGFAPDFTSYVASINGDDAIELFYDGEVIDVFGDINTDGTGTAWEYMDGWAYRMSDTGPDGDTFVLSNWTFSGKNELDGETSNATAPTPFPVGTYTSSGDGGVEPELPTLSIAATDADQVEGDSGTTTFTFTVTRSGDTSGTSAVDYATVAGTAAEGTDYVAAYGTLSFAAGETSKTVTVEIAGDTDVEDDETFTVLLSGAVDATIGTASATGTIRNDDTAPVTPTLISTIQGSGSASVYDGQEVTVQAVVTAVFSGMNGFFVQEETADEDGDAATSEGLFIYAPGMMDGLAEGYVVTVTGTVDEYYDLTELTSVSDITIEATGGDLSQITYASVAIDGLTDIDAVMEAYEGMVTTFEGTYTVTDTYTFGQYGELGLNAGDERAYNPTQLYAPGSPEALALAAQNVNSRIILDDGSTASNPDGLINPGTGTAFSADNPIRTGDQFTDFTGVVTYGYGEWRVNEVESEALSDHYTASGRDETPEDVGGTLKVASFNVLNYFTTYGSRGADNEEEFLRQEAKIVTALAAMDADVVGLIEIENAVDDAALIRLVDALNAVVGAGTYTYVDTGMIGNDAIKVAFIYKTATVQIAEGTTVAVLDTPEFLAPVSTVLDPNDLLATSAKNRPAVAVTFEEIASGETFTSVINHLKSKGSAVDGEDQNVLSGSDLGTIDGEQPVVGVDDGQGNGSATREAAADILMDWLASNPTGSDDADVLILGDLNAYASETAIGEITEGADDVAGTEDDFTDLAQEFVGADAYSYSFDGEWGTLDYALSSSSLLTQVTGVTEWHINSDEARALDYDMSYTNDTQDDLFYDTSAFRSSDHDPVIVGLTLGPAYNMVSDTGASDNLAGTEEADQFTIQGGGIDIVQALGGTDSFVLTDMLSNGQRDVLRIMDYEAGEELVGLYESDLLTSRARGSQVTLILDAEHTYDMVVLDGIDSLTAVGFDQETIV